MGPPTKKDGGPPPLSVIYTNKKDFPYQLHAEERRKFAKEVKAKRDNVRVKYSPPPVARRRQILVTVDSSRAKSNIDVLRLCLKDLGWREFPFGKRDGWCDLYWVGGSFNEAPLNLVIGAVNKFPGMVDVLRKANLTRALDSMRNLYPNEYNFYPRTWYMPQQLVEFTSEYKSKSEFDLRLSARPKTGKKPVFIAKPDEGSQGDGIYLFRDPDDFVMKPKQQVVQEYLNNPLLIDGLKFDFRVYVVLSSIDPLTIHICREGLARFCTVPYRQPSSKNMGEMYMHLTNYSLNKNSSSYVHTDNQNDGSKRTLSSVLLELGRMGHNVAKVWREIEKVVAKTMLAILPELRVEINTEASARRGMPKCCQILGFDIILLDNLRAYLLEVNASPSMRIDFEKEVSPGVSEYQPSLVDEIIKQPLVRDTLLLMAPKRYSRQRKEPNRISMKGPSNDNNVHNDNDNEKENDERNVLSDTELFSDDENNNSATNDNDVTMSARSPGRSSSGHHDDRSFSGSHRVSFGVSPEDETCLDEIYPGRYEENYRHLRILEKVALIFQQCVGIRGSLRMGATGFRAFARRHNLIGTGFSSADIDLIFIEMVRRWEYLNPDRTHGLCFQGFVDAFFTVAKRKFPQIRDRVILLQHMLDFCENNAPSVRESQKQDDKLPKILAEEERMENLKKIYGNVNLPINRRRRGIPYVFKESRDKS